MKKRMLNAIAVVVVAAVVMLNVSVGLNNNATSYLKFGTISKALAGFNCTTYPDGSMTCLNETNPSGNPSGNISGDDTGSGAECAPILGEEKNDYCYNSDGTINAIVGYFDVGGNVSVQSSAAISADIKAKNPSLSGTNLQAAVDAKLQSMKSSYGQSSGFFGFAVNLQSTTCPGYGGLCHPTNCTDAALRAINRLRQMR